MKKLILLLFCLTQALGLHAQDWVEQLVSLNADIIDSVVCMPDRSGMTDELRSYMIHYHQPLQHDEPELGELPLRALLTLRQTEDCTQQMMQSWIGGYNLDQTQICSPDSMAVVDQRLQQGELFGHYGGNWLLPEHRYFGKSCPEDPWSTLGYCEAKEAAADFHSLFEAVKKVFTGKWVISGGSKGGIATTIQHAFYPDDADCYVVYSAPFLGYYHDTRMQEYYMEHGLTPELNEKLLSIQREMLNRPTLFQLFCKLLQADTITDAHYAAYMHSVGKFDVVKRATWTRRQFEIVFEDNEKVLAAYYNNQYTDEMLLYFMLTSKMRLDGELTQWYDRTLAPILGGATRGVYGIDQKDWEDYDAFPYNYQAIHELGYYDFRWDYFYEDQKQIDEVNRLWQSWYNNSMEFETHGVFKDVKYNPDLLAFVRQQTAQAQKPILFVYGGDDAWAGAHMEDEYINGENVQLYILPEQNHRACITAVTDKELQTKLWAFTDAVLGTETGIRQIEKDDSSVNHAYDVQGRKVGGSGMGLVIRKGRVVFEK